MTHGRPGLQLIIFDCDGVLVDSERIANRIFCAMLNELGLPLSLDDMFEHFVGLSMPQCVALITQRLGRPPPEAFVPELHRRTAAALQAEVTPVAGVRDALDVLVGLRIPHCVASSGDHTKIRLTLTATGLLERFDGRIFSVEDVAHPKPAPDVFLHAARHLHADPAACAVIEDTPTGVRAGVAAGMQVFGFCANTPAHRLRAAGAHTLFADMRELPRLLAAAGAASPARH